MNKISQYIRLLRIKHYVKNILIFAPVFFSSNMFEKKILFSSIMGFLSFSLGASVIYIINDLKDVDNDRRHPKKQMRPIAAGMISVRNAIIIQFFCLIISVSISYILGIMPLLLLFVYIILNLAYSFGLKKSPIWDILILAIGFVIRLFYGGVVTGIYISKWLYLVVLSGSLYMAFGKRRNELKNGTETRDVLKLYNVAFLDKNMYVCEALAIVFYSFWTFDLSNEIIPWTIPLFIAIIMSYSLTVEGEIDGDPVEVLLSNKNLFVLIAIYGFILFFSIYFL